MPNIKVLTKPCPMCGKTKTLTVDKDNYRRWSHREMLAQEAFPELSPEDRERLISGTCPDCWNKMCASMEDDE